MVEYIERDKFIHFLFKEIAHFTETEIDIEIPISCVLQSVVNELQKFETADVQTVKHGHWETEICDDGYGAYNLFVCSLCGSESAKRFNYCRECGARMDGET